MIAYLQLTSKLNRLFYAADEKCDGGAVSRIELRKNLVDVNEFSCPYCKGTSVDHVSAPDFNRNVSDVIFHIRRCTDCGLQFLIDPPADLSRYYASDYHARIDTIGDLKPHLRYQEFKIEILKRFKTSGRLLEVGPSTGIFCYLAKQAGFEVSAIEYDAECSRFLNDKLGVRTVNSGDPAAILAAEGRTYEVITLWHAIEHIPEPWRVLEQAVRCLNPGGVLLISAPNPDAWQASVLGRRWPHYDLPRHLFLLPIPWLVSFGGKFGLTPDLVTTRDAGSLYWNRFTWDKLITAWSENEFIKKVLRRLSWLVGGTLGFVEGREGLGASYTVILRRPI